jgi:hypothetical protein
VSTTRLNSWAEVDKFSRYPGLSDLRIQVCRETFIGLHAILKAPGLMFFMFFTILAEAEMNTKSKCDAAPLVSDISGPYVMIFIVHIYRQEKIHKALAYFSV